MTYFSNCRDGKMQATEHDRFVVAKELRAVTSDMPESLLTCAVKSGSMDMVNEVFWIIEEHYGKQVGQLF